VGTATGFSLLFEMNTLFEEYIGRMLQRALAGRGLRVDLQGPRGYALTDHGTDKGRFSTRPDIVISRDGTRLLVIDTKWKRLKGEIDDQKRGVGQADVYQMMAYAHVYACEQLMLLYPHHDELDNSEGMLTAHSIARKPDSRLQIATVSLANYQTIRAQLASLVSPLISPP
jgi:5-methylcytosine-specific restriction enzyme subunit McrC